MRNFKYRVVNDKFIVITDYTGDDAVVNIPSEIDGKPVTSIGYAAFSYCTSLTSVEIPNSVTSIEDSAFSHCASLTSVKIPNSVTSIGFAAFSYCISLTSVKIPNSVVKVGDWTFFDCTSLMNVEISNSMTWIGFGVFYNCISLTSVAISDSVTSIGNRAFEYCRSLTSVTIPNSVTTIGYSAFDNCPSLTCVTIPVSVTKIEDNAFGYCYDDSTRVKTDGFTIYGYKDSVAEKYANDNGFVFVRKERKETSKERKELERIAIETLNSEYELFFDQARFYQNIPLDKQFIFDTVYRYLHTHIDNVSISVLKDIIGQKRYIISLVSVIRTKDLVCSLFDIIETEVNKNILKGEN